MIGQWPSAYLEVASTTDGNIMEQSESGNTNNSDPEKGEHRSYCSGAGDS